jgi:hypothetical protein
MPGMNTKAERRTASADVERRKPRLGTFGQWQPVRRCTTLPAMKSPLVD